MAGGLGPTYIRLDTSLWRTHFGAGRVQASILGLVLAMLVFKAES